MPALLIVAACLVEAGSSAARPPAHASRIADPTALLIWCPACLQTQMEPAGLRSLIPAASSLGARQGLPAARQHTRLHAACLHVEACSEQQVQSISYHHRLSSACPSLPPPPSLSCHRHEHTDGAECGGDPALPAAWSRSSVPGWHRQTRGKPCCIWCSHANLLGERSKRE